jgi:hypothetical protein
LTDSNRCLAKGAKAEKGQSACEKGIRKGSEPERFAAVFPSSSFATFARLWIVRN